MSMMCSGFQPISATFLMACAACFGVVALNSVSAPASFNRRICESMVGSVIS
ncbi:hypothetical protein ACVWZW_000986 [Bradyrhizobium sp. F1.13.4]